MIWFVGLLLLAILITPNNINYAMADVETRPLHIYKSWGALDKAIITIKYRTANPIAEIKETTSQVYDIGTTYSITPDNILYDSNYSYRYNSSSQSLSGTVPSGGLTITLDYIKQYSITYYPNGAAGDVIVDTIDAGAHYLVRDDDTYVYDGHDLLCWNTNPDGSGKNYFSALYVTPLDNLKLYAYWD